MNRDDLIESMATAEAAFDGRTFLGLSSVEKMRYRGRCAANLASIEAQEMAIVPVEPDDATVAAGVDEYGNWHWTEGIERDTLRAVYIAMNRAAKL